MKVKVIFCDSCGDRIFRLGFKIDGKTLCNKCVRDKYSFNVNEEDKDGSNSES